MHTFFDLSGTAFFNENTGEKLILSILPEQIESQLCSADCDPSLSSLITSGYLEWNNDNPDDNR